VPKGPDPRKDPPPLAEVPRLIRVGAHEFNARRFWHAHEAWESAWHALRAAEEAAAAEYLHGLILVAAALENATRGKEDGFKRQYAEGLYLLRTHREGTARVGVERPFELLDALALLYVDSCRRLEWARWNESGWLAPRIEVA